MKSEEEIERLEKLIGQLRGLHEEMSLLAKKSSSDAVNAFKLRLINQVLTTGNSVLGSQYLPFDDFEDFDIDDMPSNSDVALVLSQYMKEAERYRFDNIQRQFGNWYYVINGTVSDIRVDRPSEKIKR